MSENESLKLLIEAIEEHAHDNPEHDPLDTRLYDVLGKINPQAMTASARIVFAVPSKFVGRHAPDSSPISGSML